MSNLEINVISEVNGVPEVSQISDILDNQPNGLVELSHVSEDAASESLRVPHVSTVARPSINASTFLSKHLQSVGLQYLAKFR